MGNSKRRTPGYRKTATFFILISATVFTFWFIYVFWAEEDHNSKDQRYYFAHNLKTKESKVKGEHFPMLVGDDTVKRFHIQQPDVKNSNSNLIDYKKQILSNNVEQQEKSKKERENVLQHKHEDNTSEDPLTSHLLAKYCNVPDLPQSGLEGEVPTGYELKSVYTVIRHGDRTTLYTFPSHRNPSISCKITTDVSQRESHPKILSFAQTMRTFAGKQMEGSKFQSWSIFPDRNICDNSFLTPSGALQHIKNGLHFNEKYVKKLNLFGPNFSPDEINIKVTEYSRTYQSALALLYGFLPKFNLTELNLKLSRGVTFCSEKLVGSSCVCPAIQYYKMLSIREVVTANISDKIKEIRETIARVYGLELSQLPFNFAMFDILSSYACHGIKLPCNNKDQCITKETLSGLMEHLEKHNTALEKTSSFKKHNSLSSYSLLMDIGNSMMAVAHGKTNTKFSLFSGHDKTVAPLLSVLGVDSGKSVKYASRVVFELYKRHDAKDHYYIRILHDGSDVTSQVTFCTGNTKNGLCKIRHFLKFLREDILRETGQPTFSKACQVVRKKHF